MSNTANDASSTLMKSALPAEHPRNVARVGPKIGPNRYSTPRVNVPTTFAALVSDFLVRLA
jgi:hypothetical protein